MRRALVLCLLLAGCAAPPPPTDAQLQAMIFAPEREAARRAALTPAQRSAEDARRVGAADADAICRARAEMAGATYSGRGFGLAGAMTAGFEAGIAAERVRAACLDAYQRTGIMPTL